MSQEYTLQTSAIISNQESIWEQKIISKSDFKVMVQEYTESLNEKFRDKAFIDEETYKDIVKLLSENNKTLHDPNWRNWARNNFVLEIVGTNNIVHKIPSKRAKEAIEKKQAGTITLPVLIKERMWNEFCNAHVQLGHGGVSNTYAKLKSKWSNVKQDLVVKFISKCITCSLRKNSMTSEIEGKPIIAKSFLSRVQIDLIDFKTRNDNEFKYILHIRDHFSRYSWAKPITSKSASEVAGCLFEIFTEIGPPTILQSDNGKEFTAEVILNLMSLWPSVKIINGRPRHPQSQGSVERGNGILTRKLGALMEQNQSIEWVIALKLTLWGMNNSVCRATGKTPYELVYGQKPKNNLVWLDTLFEQNNNADEEFENLSLTPITKNVVAFNSNAPKKSKYKNNQTPVRKNKGKVREISSDLDNNCEEVINIEENLDEVSDINEEKNVDNESMSDNEIITIGINRPQPKPTIIKNPTPISDDTFYYREGQVNEVSWEEINETYLGLFGYSEQLNPLTTKKEILAALKDITLLRKNPNMYPTDALNVWEYKLSNWLKLYDDEQAGPSNTELTSHDYVRKHAEENLKTYTANMKELILSTAKIVKYKIGDLVKVKIPKEDKHKIDRTHLPCKILSLTGNDKYKLGCQFGVLDVSYSVRNLEPLKAHISGLEDIPRRKISLREAARLQSALHEEVTTTITENLEIT
ncbi:12379_t:CDS:2, partial [Rhizophagus irregularis]